MPILQPINRVSSSELVVHALSLPVADGIALLKACKKLDEKKYIRSLTRSSCVSNELMNKMIDSYAIYLWKINEPTWSDDARKKSVGMLLKRAVDAGSYPPPDGRWPADCNSKHDIYGALGIGADEATRLGDFGVPEWL